MAIILVVAAWAAVEAVLVIAAVAQSGAKHRPSVFAGLFDIRM
jgi:hypothetical protein